MPNKKDLTGMRFGSWTVISPADNLITPAGNSFTRWRCVCDCGVEKDVNSNSLLSGRSTSCGCVHATKQKSVARENFSTHGESKTRLYKIWAGMKKRCTNANSTSYFNYGGRGICVCEEWTSFEPFRDWAIDNGYNDSLSIDRIDNDKGYYPDNCRWADKTAQANNRRTNKLYLINGEEMTLAQASKRYGIQYKALWKQVNNGADIIEIINNI